MIDKRDKDLTQWVLLCSLFGRLSSLYFSNKDLAALRKGSLVKSVSSHFFLQPQQPLLNQSRLSPFLLICQSPHLLPGIWPEACLSSCINQHETKVLRTCRIGRANVPGSAEQGNKRMEKCLCSHCPCSICFLWILLFCLLTHYPHTVRFYFLSL